MTQQTIDYLNQTGNASRTVDDLVQAQITKELTDTAPREYVEIVGTSYALAYWDHELTCAHNRLKAAKHKLAVCHHLLQKASEFERIEDIYQDIYQEFKIARELRLDSLSAKIKVAEQNRDRVLSYGPIVGTSPGTEDDLRAQGIDNRLLSLDKIFADSD